jgi:hypothetical protein
LKYCLAGIADSAAGKPAKTSRHWQAVFLKIFFLCGLREPLSPTQKFILFCRAGMAESAGHELIRRLLHKSRRLPDSHASH